MKITVIIFVFLPVYTTKHKTDSVCLREHPLNKKLLLSTKTVFSSDGLLLFDNRSNWISDTFHTNKKCLSTTKL